MRKTFVTAIIFLLSIMTNHNLVAGSIDSLENKLKNPRVKNISGFSFNFQYCIAPVRGKSLEYSKTALELSQNLNDAADQCASLRNIGVAYSYLSQYENAEKYSGKALK